MRSRRNLPNVLIDNNYVFYEIVSWLNVNNYDVIRCMETILFNLGYDGDNYIKIDKCYIDNDGNKYLELIINNMDFNRICIFNVDVDNYPYIKIDRDENNEEIYYQLIIYDRNNIDLNMYRYCYRIGDRVNNYDSSKEWVEYSISDSDYSLELRLAKPIRLITGFGVYRQYEVNNQKKLIDYLIGLDFRRGIFDIYRDICDISFGSDMSKYTMIDLRLYRYVCDINGVIENQLTDMIYLEDGRVLSLIVSKDNKQVWYDGGMDTASYVYDGEIMQLVLDECYKNNFSSVNERINYKNNQYANGDMSGYIEDARLEIGKVKKLFNNINININLSDKGK